MKAEETIERAGRAEKLLSDPTLTEAFDLVRKGILESLELAPIRDTEGAHEMLLMLKLLRGVRAQLEQALRDGKVAVKRLEDERRLSPVDYSANFRR